MSPNLCCVQRAARKHLYLTAKMGRTVALNRLNILYENISKSETRAWLTNVPEVSSNDCGWTLAAESEAGSWWLGPPCGSWCCSGSWSPLFWVLAAPWEDWRTSRCLWTPETQRSRNPCLNGEVRGWYRGCCSHFGGPLSSLRRTHFQRRTGTPGRCCAPWSQLRCPDRGGLKTRFQRGCPETEPWGDGRA